MTCQYATSDRVQAQEVMTSRMVSDIVDSLSQLCKLKMSPEFVSIFTQRPTCITSQQHHCTCLSPIDEAAFG